MKRPYPPKSPHLTRLAMLALFGLLAAQAVGQNPELQQELQQRLADIKAASARNKQALATYTWQEQDTISLKGEVKKQETFQVHMGADGKPQKTPLQPLEQQAAQREAADGRRGGRLKERVVERKKEEFKEYAEKIGALARLYAQPDPEKLQQAFQQGNIKLSPGPDSNLVQLVISNYLKADDSLTLTFDKTAKAIKTVQISSYMDSPSDAVKVAVQFAKLPDGTNHVSTMDIDGVSKELTVAVMNTNYRKL